MSTNTNNNENSTFYPDWDAKISSYCPDFKILNEECVNLYLAMSLVQRLNKQKGMNLPHTTRQECMESLNKCMSMINFRLLFPCMMSCSQSFGSAFCHIMNLGLKEYQSKQKGVMASISSKFLTVPGSNKPVSRPSSPIDLSDLTKKLSNHQIQSESNEKDNVETSKNTSTTTPSITVSPSTPQQSTVVNNVNTKENVTSVETDKKEDKTNENKNDSQSQYDKLVALMLQQQQENNNLIHKILNEKSSGSKARTRISLEPPIYDVNKHKSLHNFGKYEYTRWALSQGLDSSDFYKYFCLVFSNKMIKDHVQNMCEHIEFPYLAQFIDNIIEETHLGEETTYKLQEKFSKFTITFPIDACFNELFNLRKLAFPSDCNELYSLRICKEKFKYLLNPNEARQSAIFQFTFNYLWEQLDSHWKVGIELRKITDQFRTNRSGMKESVSSTTKKQDTSMDMEVDAKFLTKNCETCSKAFKPSKPYYKYCFDCVKSKGKSSYTPSSQKKGPAPKKKAYKSTNNLETVEEGDQINNVSIKRNGYEIVKCVLNKFQSNDCLFDVGSGPSCIRKDFLVRNNIQSLIEKVPNDIYIRQGDSSTMNGLLGVINLDASLIDSLNYVTKSVIQRFFVFESLNHEIIAGRNFIKKTTRRYIIYPSLDTIIFDPTIKKVKHYNKLEIEHEKRLQVKNNSMTDDKNQSNKKHIHNIDFSSEDNEFILNVPACKFNQERFDLFFPTGVFGTLTETFMNNLEDVLSDGGIFEDDINKNAIETAETETLSTKLGEVKVGKTMSKSMKEKFKRFLDGYQGKLFDNSELGKTKIEADIKLKENISPSDMPAPRYIPLNPTMQEEARKLVTAMHDLGVLEPTTEKANSTMFIVQKTSGKWRLICDLRQLNERLQDYVVHLPSPYELINKIGKFSLFSYCDYPDAYFNIPCSENSLKHAPIVACVSGMDQNYKYKRLPQGLKTSCAHFVNILNEIYVSILDWLILYLDDSVIGSEDDEEFHFDRLKQFFKITEEAGLKLSVKKCVFFVKQVQFLGFSLENGKFGLSKEQRETIELLSAENLTDKKRESLASFLQYFNKFSCGVAAAARKIRDDTIPEAEIKVILSTIKKQLVESKMLETVNFKDDLYIFSDASQEDCSAVILQKTGRIYNLVTCFSRKLPATIINKNADTYQKELWCLQQVARTFRYIFIGSHRKVFHIDNAAVVASQKSKAPSIRCLFENMKAMYGPNIEFKYSTQGFQSTHLPAW